MSVRWLILVALTVAFGWFILAATVGGFLIAIGAAERETVASTLFCAAIACPLGWTVMQMRRAA